MCSYSSEGSNVKSKFSEQFNLRAIAERKRETWRYKKMQSESALDAARHKKNMDVKRRAPGREKISVALGLAKCRKLRGQSQTDFANFLGISRRALVNYETGRRVASCNLLEQILADGQTDLHDVFNLKPEPIPIDTRLEIADLTARLTAACIEQYPKADLDRVLSLVKHHVAWWPKSRRGSDRNIEKAATDILEVIATWEAEEAYWDRQQEVG